MKMKYFSLHIIFWVLCLYLFQIGFGAEAKPKYGPVGNPYAAPLALDHSYFQSPKHPSPDFWALIGYYVPQYNGAACSAASVTMVLNAAKAALPKTADDKLVLQPELVEKTTAGGWKERLSLEGFGPKKTHGTPLAVAREVAEAAFKANGFPNVQVEAVHVRDESEKTKKAIHQLLVTNEKSTADFIIANFDQKFFTDDSNAGHIAPVGAYDGEKKRILILDPDREWYEPYWISEERFIAGMNTKDSETDENKGLLIIRNIRPNRPNSPTGN